MVTSNLVAAEQPHYRFCNGSQIRVSFVCVLRNTHNLPQIKIYECPMSFANQVEMMCHSGSTQSFASC